MWCRYALSLNTSSVRITGLIYTFPYKPGVIPQNKAHSKVCLQIKVTEFYYPLLHLSFCSLYLPDTSQSPQLIIGLMYQWAVWPDYVIWHAKLANVFSFPISLLAMPNIVVNLPRELVFHLFIYTTSRKGLWTQRHTHSLCSSGLHLVLFSYKGI